jgi:hypothetical protein
MGADDDSAAVGRPTSDRYTEIADRVRRVARMLDGSRRAEAALAGLTAEQVDELGGVRE